MNSEEQARYWTGIVEVSSEFPLSNGVKSAPLHSRNFAPFDMWGQLRRRLAYERASALDDISRKDYAARRREQLREIPGGAAVSAQYGIHIAEERVSQGGLMLHNDNSAGYHRSRARSSKHFHADCFTVYQRQGGRSGAGHVVFVNGPRAARDVQAKLPLDLRQATKTWNVAPGLSAIEAPDEDGATEVDRRIRMTGARPSAYQVTRLVAGPSTSARDPNIKNSELLRRLDPRSPGSAIAQLRSIPHDHAAHVIAQISASLLDDLRTVLSPMYNNPALAQNPVHADGLRTLISTAESLPTLADDSIKFSNAYLAMIEELSVALVTAHPYREVHFKGVTGRLLQSRMGWTAAAEGWRVPETFLMSSGMGALSCGLDVAAALNGGNRDVSLAAELSPYGGPDYYESINLLSRQGRLVKSSNAVFATLNPSLPRQRGSDDRAGAWNVQTLIGSLEKKLDSKRDSVPITVVLDATIEREGDLSSLLDRFGRVIALGGMRFIVCKSYQKYVNLGTAKVMAGSIAFFCNLHPENVQATAMLRQAELDLDWGRNEEMQLMVHLLRSGYHEFAYLRQASDNAAFVVSRCFGGGGLASYSPGLPMVTIKVPAKGPIFDSGGKGLEDVNMQDHLEGPVHARNSFGFTETTYSTIPNFAPDIEKVMRISLGQESRTELMEKFYATGLMAADGTRDWNVEMAARQVLWLIEKAAPSPSMPARPLADPYGNLARVGAFDAGLKDDDLHKTFALSKIVSILDHLHRLLDKNGGLGKGALLQTEREAVDRMIDAMMESGMRGVSRNGRRLVARFKAELAREDLRSHDPAECRRGCESLIACAPFLDMLEDRADILTAVTNGGFHFGLDRRTGDPGHDPSLGGKLIDSLFRPLDIEARLAFISSCIETRLTRLAGVCIEAMKQDLSHDEPVLRPIDLTDRLRRGRSPSPTIDAQERRNYETRLSQIEGSLQSALQARRARRAARP